MKIDIFSGFLGSGKTTLIKKLIKEAYSGEKVVLIENEFGEIGIDGGFLKDAGIEITEMNSGCICCSLVGDFAKALQEVVSQYNPDRIIIEPSGVGKLSDVARAVESGLNGHPINSMTTVINAKKAKMYSKNFGEFFNDQLETANCIVLSHTDVATPEVVEECLKFVKEKNPNAAVVATSINELDGKMILEAMEKSLRSTKDIIDELMKEHEHDEDEHCHHHHHDHDEDEEECHCHRHHEHDEDDDEDEHEHCHHHHHDHDEDEEECHCHHHHDHDEDDDDEDEHEHCHHHHHDHDEDEEECCCHHHHHHADEVFTSWGVETTKKYSKEQLIQIMNELSNEEKYGIILRAKGIVQDENGQWLNFDYIPEGIDVRNGATDIVGKLCVIGSKVNEKAIAELFGIKE
ncbi:MAG: cobalamin biosynthesis protein CobW [Clostridia bacterium]|nr:cobalamin biosynthesis protein CobW [Clostridia bacterium]